MNICQRWAQTTIANKLMVYTTVLVAFGTLFYAGVAYFQWKLMEESGKQASLQAAEAIVEIRRVADSASESSRTARAAIDASIDTSRLEQRAWVGVTEVSPAPYVESDKRVFVKDGQKIKAELVVKNTGRTPATRLKSLITLHYLRAGEEIVIDKARLGGLADSNRVLHPGAVAYLQTSELEGFPNPSDIENVVKRRSYVYITAVITYNDVFDRPHSTEFCAVLMPDLGSFGLCKTHNNAD